MNRQYGALSGLAVALIVLNHAVHFSLQTGTVGPGWWPQVLTTLQAFGAFAVPSFLFISGAFLAYAANGLTLTFLRSSLERILWPYVLWSAAFYLVQALGTGEVFAPSGYAKNLLVGYPYHFVPLLVVCYAAAPLMVRLGRRRGLSVLAVIACYQAFLLGLLLLGRSAPEWTRLVRPPIVFRTVAEWGVYFPLGLLLTLHQGRVKPHLSRWRTLLFAATAGLFGLGLLNAFGVVTAPWARFVAPVPAVLLLPVIDRASIPVAARLEWLGRRSYGMYLCHFVVLSIAALVLLRLGVRPWSPAAVVPFFVVGLGVPLLLMNAMGSTEITRRAFRLAFGVVPAGPQDRRGAVRRPPGSPVS